MKIEWRDEFETGDKVIKLRITATEMQRVHLDRFDRLLLNDCGGPNASISDRILGLETLCRRIEQI